MGKVEVINALEQLAKFQNKDGIIEIAIRGQNKRFESFTKVALEQLQQSEASEQVKKAIDLIKQNNLISENNANILKGIATLNKLSLVLNCANLCATCAGFAIMYAKLDKMSAQISKVVSVYKEGKAIDTKFEFNKIISEHSNMLDCRKKQSYYTEDQMRELVDGEYNVLCMLIDTFLADVSSNRDELLFSIMSLAQMLSASVVYFDEIYYFENKAAIGDGDRWHFSHGKWLAIFDTLISNDFIEVLEDYGIFEKGLNTVENDVFCTEFYDQVKGLKQNIEDNQKLITAFDDPELFMAYKIQMNEIVATEIKAAFEEAGVPTEVREDYLRVAAA